MSLPSNLRVSNGSYLRVPHSEDFNFGSGDFTIEFWVKFNTWLNDRGVVAKGWPSHAGAFLVYVHNNSRMAFYASSNGSNWDIADSATIATELVINTWYHVAITRSGSTFRTFINGSLTSSWSNSAALVNNSSKSLTIGNGDNGQNPIDGWIDALRITKGVARYTSSFVPSPLDPATASSFDDSSRFNRPIGNKGPTVISSSQSQFGGSSAYFDSNSYLSVPGDQAWQLGTEDFTVEAWINPDTVTNTRSIVGNYDGADGGWRLAVKSPTGGTPSYSPEISFTKTNGGSEVDIIIPGVLEITRSNQYSIYNSAKQSAWSGPIWMMGPQNPTDTEWALGWNDECGVVNKTFGSFTNLWGGGQVGNNVVNAELVMRHIPTQRIWFIKFSSWTVLGNGGGFAYTRKELTCSTNTSIVQFRNGNNTVIEKSVSPPLASGTWYHLAASRANNSLKLFLDGNELGPSVSDPFTADLNRINTNGLTIGSSRSSSNIVTDSYKGYIDDLRITKGVARYTSNFTRPAAPAPALGPAPIAPNSPTGLAVTERDNIFKVSLTPPSFDGRSPITSYNFQYSTDGSTWNNVSSVSDPHYDKVSLLLPMTGSNNSFNIFDDSKYNHNVSIVGDTKISTAQSWFNNGSAVFDGSVDNLVIENNTAFDLRNQDWTIEGWIRPTGDWSKYNTIISKRGNGGGEGTDGDWQLYLRQSNGVLSFYSATVGGQESGIAPFVNIWNHVAAVRNGRIITLYLNGISVLSFVADTLYTTNRKVYVGGWPAGNEYFYGHMNDIRVTKGVARYTSNFDPRLLTQAPANRISGLSTVGTPYIFRARTVNAIGSSDYSSSITSSISTLGAPTNLNIIPDSDKAYLSWTAPASNNSAIRDYSVQYSADNGNTWTTYVHNPNITTSIVVDGLTIGTSYLFRVAAVNMAGTGAYVTSTSPALTAPREDNTYNKTRLLLHLDSN